MTTSRARSTVIPLCARACAYAVANRSTSSGSCGEMTVASIEIETERRGPGADLVLLAEQGQVGDPAAEQDRRGLEDPVVGALGQHDVLAVGAGALHQLVLEHQRRAHLRRRDVDRGEQRGLVDLLGEQPPGRLDLVGGVLGHRPAHPQQPLGRGERAELGERDRQVLLDALGQPPDRVGHLVAAGQHDAGQGRERAGLVGQHQARDQVGAVAGRDHRDVGPQPGQHVGQAHRGHDQTRATPGPSRSRCPAPARRRRPRPARGRSAPTASGSPRSPRSPGPGRSARAAPDRSTASLGSTRLAITATVCAWLARSSASALSAAARIWSGVRSRPCTTSTTGEPRLAAILALKDSSVPVETSV